MIRRSFLKWVCGTIWTACGAVVAVPIVRFVLAPLRPRADEQDAITRLVTPLAELEVGVPRKFALIGKRIDAWTVYPNQPIGHVWLVRHDDSAVAAAGEESVDAGEGEARPAPVAAFSATCPHLGCMIQKGPEGDSFECPCHKAAFAIDGSLKQPESGTENPSPRGMDRLECRIVADDAGVDWVEVAYQTFKLGTREPEPKS